MIAKICQKNSANYGWKRPKSIVIVGLSRTQRGDCLIWLVVDLLTKLAELIPSNNLSFGLPICSWIVLIFRGYELIVNIKFSKFTSDFWAQDVCMYVCVCVCVCIGLLYATEESLSPPWISSLFPGCRLTSRNVFGREYQTRMESLKTKTRGGTYTASCFQTSG